MEGDGKPVRLVADPLQQEQRRIVGRQPDGLDVVPREDQLLFLCQADGHQVRQPERFERLVGGLQLALAAVDHDQVRKRPALLEHAPIPPLRRPVHGGEVVQERSSLVIQSYRHSSFVARP